MKKTTPFIQAMKMLKTKHQRMILLQNCFPLKDSYIDDFCLAIVAYLKWGINREFDNMLMQTLFDAFRDMLIRDSKTNH